MQQSSGSHIVWAALLALSTQSPNVSAVTSRQLVEVVDITGISTSPDGKLVAFRADRASVDRNVYDTVWYVQPIWSSAPPRRLGEAGPAMHDAGGEVPNEPAQWSPDGGWIYYRALLDGRVDVWRAAVDGGRTERVTRDPANVRSFVLSGDGTTLFYSVGATREEVGDAELDEYDHGVHIDRSVPLGDSLFRSGYHEGRLATQRLVDNEVMGSQLLSQTPERWKVVDLRTGTTREMDAKQVPARGPARIELPQDLGSAVKVAEAGDGRIAFLARAGERRTGAEGPTLGVLGRRKTGKPILCVATACARTRITEITWRPERDEVVFTVTDEAMGQALYRWNVADGTVHAVAASRGQLGGGGRWDTGACAASPDALVCVAADPDRPPRLERVDLESGERRILFDPNIDLTIDLAETVTVESAVWKDREGRNYTGQLYRPLERVGEPAPLFVAYYRCAGFIRGGMGDEWPMATLAKHGIAALCINSAPFDEDALARFRHAQAAVESAVEHLASLGYVDPARVGLGGLSFGAEVSLWMAVNSTVPRAISVSTPVVSPLMHLLMSPWEETHRSRLRRYWQLGGTETLERWREISPVLDPEQVRAPVLMQMSEQEYRYSLDYAVPLMRMDKADLYVFPHEKHQKTMPRHKLAVYERNLDWFRFWLLDTEESDPAKLAQYARWREMKHQQAKAPRS